jgi:hypothetical protein
MQKVCFRLQSSFKRSSPVTAKHWLYKLLHDDWQFRRTVAPNPGAVPLEFPPQVERPLESIPQRSGAASPFWA